MMKSNAIVIEKLYKSFKDVKVLDGINLYVPKGTIFALLGPNGAGKTTTIKILSTLLMPDKGKINVNGFDVVKDRDKVRASIGLTGQFNAVDEYLTGRENLVMMGRLYHLSGSEAEKKADKLLEQFDLINAKSRIVKTYSGGMSRRLDLAASLIANPPIVILDEPTTGLDPRSRLTMWEIIKQLVAEGTTILLTTQYMDEADSLADKIVVLDGGKIIAEGSASELKNKVGSDRLEFTFPNKNDVEKAQKILSGNKLSVEINSHTINIPTKNGPKDLRETLDKLNKAKINLESISLHRPTLDDVFLSLTGHGTGGEENEK